MKHDDVVTRASSVLRDAYSGETETAALARQRILASVSRKSSKKRFRLFLGTPLLAVIVGSTAWAAQGGRLEAVWHTVASVLSSSGPESNAVRAAASAPKQHPAARTADLTDPATNELPTTNEAAEHSADSIPESSPTQSTRQAATPEPSVEHRASAIARPKTQKAPVPELPAAPVAPPDLELVVFRKAHDLHFSGNSPDSAVTAYRDYIQQFPSGRFVPEARYNLALNHIKLGDKALARQELTPFAEGKFGGYRKADAQRLLEALR
jgi:TolA-binding protein